MYVHARRITDGCLTVRYGPVNLTVHDMIQAHTYDTKVLSDLFPDLIGKLRELRNAKEIERN
jgi:hypothetical protein